MTDQNGTGTFGDGSNNWIGGAADFADDPGQLLRDPYDTVAGAADAAALNFDEGVGGLSSLVDDEAGNTAGPGDSPFLEAPQDGQPDNPGTTGSPLLDGIFGVAVVVMVTAGLWLIRPLLEILASIVEAVVGG